MKTLIITILLLAGSLPKCHAQTWVSFPEAGSTYSYSPEVTYNSPTCRMWTKKQEKTYKAKKGKIYKNVSKLTLWEVNCSSREAAFVYFIYKDDRGRLIDMASFEDDKEWLPTAPNSTGEAIVDKACELKAAKEGRQ